MQADCVKAYRGGHLCRATLQEARTRGRTIAPQGIKQKSTEAAGQRQSGAALAVKGEQATINKGRAKRSQHKRAEPAKKVSEEWRTACGGLRATRRNEHLITLWPVAKPRGACEVAARGPFATYSNEVLCDGFFS